MNYLSNAFELVDQRPATGADSKSSILVQNQPSRFISGNGTVQAKMTFQQMNQPFNKLWTASIDKIHWLMK